MARIVFGSYMMRYPMGGMLSCMLQFLVGFKRLGHDVHLVEKANYPNACFDPSTITVGDDPRAGIAIVTELLSRFELGDRWCFTFPTPSANWGTVTHFGIFDAASLAL